MTDKRLSKLVAKHAAMMFSLRLGIPVTLEEEFELDGIVYKYNRVIHPDGTMKFYVPHVTRSGGGTLVMHTRDDLTGCYCEELDYRDDGEWCGGNSPWVNVGGESSYLILREFHTKYDPTIRF